MARSFDNLHGSASLVNAARSISLAFFRALGPSDPKIISKARAPVMLSRLRNCAQCTVASTSLGQMALHRRRKLSGCCGKRQRRESVSILIQGIAPVLEHASYQFTEVCQPDWSEEPISCRDIDQWAVRVKSISNKPTMPREGDRTERR
jgi:hypothetical protein